MVVLTIAVAALFNTCNAQETNNNVEQLTIGVSNRFVYNVYTAEKWSDDDQVFYQTPHSYIDVYSSAMPTLNVQFGQNNAKVGVHIGNSVGLHCEFGDILNVRVNLVEYAFHAKYASTGLGIGSNIPLNKAKSWYFTIHSNINLVWAADNSLRISGFSYRPIELGIKYNFIKK
jgi:hypothetical protein